jgi:hypothetical protein
MAKNITKYLLGMVVIICCACSSYDEDFELRSKAPAPATENDTTSKTPTTPQTGLWGTVVSKSYREENGHWMSRIVVQKDNGDTVHCVVELPWIYTLTGPDHKVIEGNVPSAYAGWDTPSRTAGKWYGNNNGDTIRVHNTNVALDMSNYKLDLSMQYAEAYCIINGKREAYLSGTEPIYTFYANGHDRSASEIKVGGEKVDSIFGRETNKVTVNISFNKETFTPSKTTVVDHLIKTEATQEIPTTPTVEPSFTFAVDDVIESIEQSTLAPNTHTLSAISDWYTVTIIKGRKAYYIVENNKLVATWLRSEVVEPVRAYTSCIHDNGRIIPALITPQSDGSWTYSAELTGASKAIVLDMPMQVALNSGIRNFKSGTTAKVTYKISTSFDTVNNGNYTYTHVTGQTNSKESPRYVDFTVKSVRG